MSGSQLTGLVIVAVVLLLFFVLLFFVVFVWFQFTCTCKVANKLQEFCETVNRIISLNSWEVCVCRGGGEGGGGGSHIKMMGMLVISLGGANQRFLSSCDIKLSILCKTTKTRS